jgi:hypothetical protein
MFIQPYQIQSAQLERPVNAGQVSFEGKTKKAPAAPQKGSFSDIAEKHISNISKKHNVPIADVRKTFEVISSLTEGDFSLTAHSESASMRMLERFYTQKSTKNVKQAYTEHVQEMLKKFAEGNKAPLDQVLAFYEDRLQSTDFNGLRLNSDNDIFEMLKQSFPYPKPNNDKPRMTTQALQETGRVPFIREPGRAYTQAMNENGRM